MFVSASSFNPRAVHLLSFDGKFPNKLRSAGDEFFMEISVNLLRQVNARQQQDGQHVS